MVHFAWIWQGRIQRVLQPNLVIVSLYSLVTRQEPWQRTNVFRWQNRSHYELITSLSSDRLTVLLPVLSELAAAVLLLLVLLSAAALLDLFQRQRWGHFWGGAHNYGLFRAFMGFSEHIHTILNWTEPSAKSTSGVHTWWRRLVTFQGRFKKRRRIGFSLLKYLPEVCNL